MQLLAVTAAAAQLFIKPRRQLSPDWLSTLGPSQHNLALSSPGIIQRLYQGGGTKEVLGSAKQKLRVLELCN